MIQSVDTGIESNIIQCNSPSLHLLCYSCSLEALAQSSHTRSLDMINADTSCPPNWDAMIVSSEIDSARPVKVICIGAGVGGIITGIRLPQHLKNLDLVIYDKNPEVGGTWYENRYGLALPLIPQIHLCIKSDELRQQISGCPLRYSQPRLPVDL